MQRGINLGNGGRDQGRRSRPVHEEGLCASIHGCRWSDVMLTCLHTCWWWSEASAARSWHWGRRRRRRPGHRLVGVIVGVAEDVVQLE